jgi:hypothetical protein
MSSRGGMLSTQPEAVLIIKPKPKDKTVKKKKGDVNLA